MKLTILGSGTCVNQLPSIPNRYPPAYVVEWGDEKIMFDCSEGVRFRLEQAGFDYTSINHMAISHSHADHCAIPQFIQAKYVHYWWNNQENQDIFIYCPSHIANNFKSLWDFYNQDVEEVWKPIHVVSMSHPERSEQVGSGLLKAFSVHHGHGKVDACAYRLETPEGIFAYSGDTGDCEGVRTACQDADMFVCEASARIRDEKTQQAYGHLTPQQVGEIATSSKVKKVVLVHYQGFDSDEEMEKAIYSTGFKGEVIIGKDFQIITPQ